ncbi:uncharacterized protein LOC126053993 [Helicoverpa armigera]|uniref:uncharacterized protein LOC126053993 n=1 Tax=Helicoverpa armigera TaxID=29058 RepID=UPI003083A92E
MPNEAIPESSQTSDVERHTETENAPTKSQLPEASIEEAPPPQLQDLASEASMPSPSEPARKKKLHNPKKTQPQEDSADIMLAEALECLQKSSIDITDPYSSFGRHIANELRKYDPDTLAYVKNAINNIIFEADIGKYAQQQINTGYYTQQYSNSSTMDSSGTSSSASHTATSSHAITPSPDANVGFETITEL